MQIPSDVGGRFSLGISSVSQTESVRCSIIKRKRVHMGIVTKKCPSAIRPTSSRGRGTRWKQMSSCPASLVGDLMRRDPDLVERILVTAELADDTVVRSGT